jgi:hypothetical protein
MSETIKDAEDAPDPALDHAWASSYTYLRLAIVGLLIALGAAVFWQTLRQGWTVLSSVSAYYYTPAQAIFVGALIGMGACMIALRGWHEVEEIFLNIGGMCAMVVAIVPTARDADYQTARQACATAAGPLLTQAPAQGLDCPTIQALEAATRANVENNSAALLFVGVLGIAAAVGFARRDQMLRDHGFRWGIGAVTALWLAVLAVRVFATPLLVERGHFVAAISLLVCLAIVAAVNAVRRNVMTQDNPGGSANPASISTAGTVLMRSPARFNRYAWLAWLMLAAAVIGGVLAYLGVVDVFWLEIVVATLFVAFWVVQTIELLQPRPA